jgi:hypothetical protein
MLVPLNFTGGTYLDRSRSLISEVCKNFYPKMFDDNQNVKSKYVLQNWVGLKSFASVTPPVAGASRGLFEHQNVLYHIVGNYLYKILNGTSTHILVGLVNGNTPCIIRGFGNGIVIASEAVAFYYDGTTLQQVVDADLESPNTLDVLNSQVIYQGNDGRFAVSAVGDALDLPALNYATAESNADDLQRVFSYNQRLYLFGEKTIETWWNSGSGSPPFDPVEGGLIQRGTPAKYSVASNDNDVFFISDDRQVFSLSGQKLSTKYLNRLMRDHDVSDAEGFCMTLEGQDFYVLNIPSAYKTFVCPIGGEWFQWSYGDSDGRALINNYAFFNGKHLGSSYQDGALYELDFDTYDDAGDPIIRVRDSQVIHAGLFGKDGKKIFASRLELLLDVGVGITSGQGSDPEIMLSFSDDGGRTFSTERRAKIGKVGQFRQRVEWHALGSFVNRIFRLSISDPVYVSIHSAVLDLEIGL